MLDSIQGVKMNQVCIILTFLSLFLFTYEVTIIFHLEIIKTFKLIYKGFFLRLTDHRNKYI